MSSVVSMCGSDGVEIDCRTELIKDIPYFRALLHFKSGKLVESNLPFNSTSLKLFFDWFEQKDPFYHFKCDRATFADFGNIMSYLMVDDPNKSKWKQAALMFGAQHGYGDIVSDLLFDQKLGCANATIAAASYGNCDIVYQLVRGSPNLGRLAALSAIGPSPHSKDYNEMNQRYKEKMEDYDQILTKYKEFVEPGRIIIDAVSNRNFRVVKLCVEEWDCYDHDRIDQPIWFAARARSLEILEYLVDKFHYQNWKNIIDAAYSHPEVITWCEEYKIRTS